MSNRPRRPAGPVLTYADALIVFDYDPATGSLKWRCGPYSSHEAGHLSTRGDMRLEILDTMYQVHRVVWLIMTGKWPPGGRTVQHIDRDQSNMRWTNLRLANRSQQAAGARRNTRNTSGYKGVVWCAQQGKWRARVKYHGKVTALGTFDDPEEAADAYQTTARKLWGHYFRP
jgi:hypothetical protein